jgi:hypothetical protein
MDLETIDPEDLNPTQKIERGLQKLQREQDAQRRKPALAPDADYLSPTELIDEGLKDLQR